MELVTLNNQRLEKPAVSEEEKSRIRIAASLRQQKLKALFGIIWQLSITGLAILLSLQGQWYWWLLGQMTLSIVMVQWFFLLHDFGHGSYFKSKKLNDVFGLLASVFSLLPYYPWKLVHHAHHKWTGWREFDPTIPERKFEELTPGQIRFIDFCWKYWIPIFAFSYTIQTFYRLPKLRLLFPGKKNDQKMSRSIFFIALSHLSMLILLGPFSYIQLWLLAFILYLTISDPMLLSQHTHLDYHDIEIEDVKPVRHIDQSFFSRSIVYPLWMEKYLLYFSNRHGLHHQFPWIPTYQLGKMENPEENRISWLEWLRIAKSMPGHLLIFRSTKHTGVKL